MVELTEWQQVIKKQLLYEVVNLWDLLREYGKVHLNHCFMNIEISTNPLKVNFPNGIAEFGQSLRPFLDLIEERIKQDPLGFDAQEFDTEVLLSSLRS